MVIDIARSSGGGSIIGTVRIGDDSVQIVRCMGLVIYIAPNTNACGESHLPTCHPC